MSTFYTGLYLQRDVTYEEAKQFADENGMLLHHYFPLFTSTSSVLRYFCLSSFRFTFLRS